MLNGLLGRGFSAKCKSLIKMTRTRIEVVRRRVVAKQKFLKEDLGKLLSNGLDINAFGRTEEFVAGMNLLWCYDYVQQFGEYIIKQLPKMQKQGECPEESREAVASLVFAAARFSDLPELRDLRDIFRQRYGSCLDSFVNQKFVERVSPRPPTTEDKIQVLKKIASEFSIRWDAKAFEQRMVSSSVQCRPTVQDNISDLQNLLAGVQNANRVKQGSVLLDEEKEPGSYRDDNLRGKAEDDWQFAGRKESINYKENSLLKKGGSSSQGYASFPERQTVTENKDSYSVEKDYKESKVERLRRLSHGKMSEKGDMGCTRSNYGNFRPRKVESTEALFHGDAEFASGFAEDLGRKKNVESSFSYSDQDKTQNTTRKSLDKESDRLRSSSYAVPPPYVKPKDNFMRPPYTKPKEDKLRLNSGSNAVVSTLGEKFVIPLSCNASDVVSSSGKPANKEADYLHCEKATKIHEYGHILELEHQDEKFPLPKPRSVQRKHHKSASSSNNMDTIEDVGIMSRSSSSRRKDHSGKGLRVLFDEEHHRKDEEEKLIDKLLIHYSKKSSSSAAGKSKSILPGPPSHKIIIDTGQLSYSQGRHSYDSKHEELPASSRSISLPHNETDSPGMKKVFARANTFQPDIQARHVHPKLPDYDDLAARFSALRGRQVMRADGA